MFICRLIHGRCSLDGDVELDLIIQQQLAKLEELEQRKRSSQTGVNTDHCYKYVFQQRRKDLKFTATIPRIPGIFKDNIFQNVNICIEKILFKICKATAHL